MFRKAFMGRNILRFVVFCVLFLFCSSAMGGRIWYPVTAGSFTGLRLDNVDQILVERHEYEYGVTYGLRSHPPKGVPQSATCFILLDLNEAKTINEIHFQNQTHRAATTNIGFVEVYVAENEEDEGFDPLSKEGYTKSIYRGAIQPVMNTQGLIRKIRFPEIKRRYFLIEAIATNKDIPNIDKPDYKIGTVQFSDINISEK